MHLDEEILCFPYMPCQRTASELSEAFAIVSYVKIVQLHNMLHKTASLSVPN